MFYSQEIIERVREANAIEEVVGHYIPLRGNKGLCPFHDDHKPSFSVSSKKQIARCFVCMPHALDVFGFIMLIEKVSFLEAIKILADRKGIELPDLTDEQKQSLVKQKRKEEILKATADFYYEQLLSAIELGK